MGGAWSDMLLTCTSGASPDPENVAFVFIKPHALTPAVMALTAERLSRSGLRILEAGTVPTEEIERRGLVDKHYTSLAKWATKLDPGQLAVPGEAFTAKFGERWSVLMQRGAVLAAKEACDKFGWSEEQLSARWDIAVWRNQVIELGSGFYCGRIDLDAGDQVVVVNGFYPRMRAPRPPPFLYALLLVAEQGKAPVPSTVPSLAASARPVSLQALTVVPSATQDASSRCLAVRFATTSCSSTRWR